MNYLYNGVNLPPTPEINWDKETYPNMLITGPSSSGWYSMVVFSAPIKVDSDGYLVTEAALKYVSFTLYPEHKVGWQYLTAGTTSAEWKRTDPYVWSNHNICDADGTVVYAASEPIPGGQSDAISRYWYNHLTLPKLPERDKEALPYVVIIQSSGTHTYAAYFMENPMYCASTSAGVPYPHYPDSGTNQKATWSCTGSSETWGELENVSLGDGELGHVSSGGARPYRLVWINHDVYTDDGTLYLAASDPVPVTTYSIDPKALLMGWLTGRKIAGQRKKA